MGRHQPQDGDTVSRAKPMGTLVLVKGNMERQGESRRYFDALAVMRACADASGGSLKVGENCSVLSVPVAEGDPARVFDDVLSRIDIQKTESVQEALEMGAKVLAVADRVNCPRSAFSLKVVERHLDMMYMRYDVWSD